MTMDNFIKDIKKYLSNEKTNWQYCFDFYVNLEKNAPYAKLTNEEKDFVEYILEEICETIEPDIDLKYYKIYDELLVQALKKYNY